MQMSDFVQISQAGYSTALPWPTEVKQAQKTRGRCLTCLLAQASRYQGLQLVFFYSGHVLFIMSKHSLVEESEQQSPWTLVLGRLYKAPVSLPGDLGWDKW